MSTRERDKEEEIKTKKQKPAEDEKELNKNSIINNFSPGANTKVNQKIQNILK